MVEQSRVSEDEHLRMPRNGAVRLDDGPARVVERCAETLEDRAGHVAGGPDHRLGRDGPSCRYDRAGPDIGDEGLGAHLHPEAAELELGLVAQAWRVGGQQAESALEEQHGGFARIDVPEVAPESVPAELGQRSCRFHPGGSAAHHHERQ